MHQAAVTDGRQHGGHGNFATEYGGTQIRIGKRDGMARAKCHVVEDAAIFAESDFAFGATVEIVKDYGGETALGDAPEIVNVHYFGWI
jgi:hypothetical protein